MIYVPSFLKNWLTNSSFDIYDWIGDGIFVGDLSHLVWQPCECDWGQCSIQKQANVNGFFVHELYSIPHCIK